MKLNFPYRITALILAFMLFITSIGFSIDVHFCKGEMKSISLFGTAESCHAKKSKCHNHLETTLNIKEQISNCCSNQTFQIEILDEDFNASILNELKDLQFKFSVSFVYSFFSSTPIQEVKSSFLDSQVHLLPRDIYVLLERFLI